MISPHFAHVMQVLLSNLSTDRWHLSKEQSCAWFHGPLKLVLGGLVSAPAAMAQIIKGKWHHQRYMVSLSGGQNPRLGAHPVQRISTSKRGKLEAAEHQRPRGKGDQTLTVQTWFSPCKHSQLHTDTRVTPVCTFTLGPSRWIGSIH